MGKVIRWKHLDSCPVCGRRITDYDLNGCETLSGQRYCVQHAPHFAELFDVDEGQ